MPLRLTNHGNPWTAHDDETICRYLNEIALYTLADILGRKPENVLSRAAKLNLVMPSTVWMYKDARDALISSDFDKLSRALNP